MDEVAQIPEDIINMVIIPMMNTRQDPFDTSGRKNHLVMASSAYYQFNHLYKKYRDYLELTNQNSPEYDPNYGLHVYTVDDMPDGWMDKAIIKQARRQMTELQYQMEYLCFPPSTPITTTNGIKPIEEIKSGDVVLTHLSNKQKVVKLLNRKYDSKLYSVSAYGSYKKLEATLSHPIYIYRDGKYMWEEIQNIKIGDMLVKPFETDIVDISEISLMDYINIDYLSVLNNGHMYIYPKQPWFSGDISAKQQIGKPSIKSAIKNNICVNKAFMRLAGYYLAKGSSLNNNQRALIFLLNKNEQRYAEEIKRDLYEVFGIFASESRVNDVTFVHTNNIILSNFFENFLGKDRFDKSINPVLLKQRNDLLLELVKSAWDIGGKLSYSKNGKKILSSYYSASSKLADDMSIALARLGVVSNIKHKKGNGGNKEYACVVYGSSDSKSYSLFSKEYIDGTKVECMSNYIAHKGDHLLCKVKQIGSRDFRGTVYNLEVENDNSYCANGFAVHNCIFPPDSDGFFPASLVKDVRKQSVLIETDGEKGAKYVFGIDPARSGDNFALAAVRLGPPNKVIAVYSLSKNTFPQMHEFIRMKIRDYEKNGGQVVRIQMDNGGGGQTLKDYLAEEYAWFNIETNKWETMPAILDIEDSEHQYLSGKRILKMQVFNAQSINSMNFDLRADMEQKKILMPLLPPTEEGENGYVYISIFEEIEEMIQEIMTIVTTPLKNGFMHFDTPKQRMKKDRYSALLLAAQGAREIQREVVGPPKKKLAKGFVSNTFLTN